MGQLPSTISCLVVDLVGVRGTITLYNKLNYPATFTWTPILGKRGTAFSIRPATGNYSVNNYIGFYYAFSDLLSSGNSTNYVSCGHVWSMIYLKFYK